MRPQCNNQTFVCRGCGKPFTRAHVGRGYCSTVCANRSRSRPLDERFWEKVKRSDGCWEWQGAMRPNGYGEVGLRTDVIGSAHRVAWELTYGPIPAGLHVLHRCDNRRCVRPDHLFLGTNDDNIRDMVAKARNSRGAVASHKLSEADVREIRRLCESGVPQRLIAEQFGIHRGAVSQIRRRVAWKYVD